MQSTILELQVCVVQHSLSVVRSLHMQDTKLTSICDGDLEHRVGTVVDYVVQ